MAILTADEVLVGAMAVLAAASLPRRPTALRGGLVLLGAVGLFWAIDRHRGLLAGSAAGALLMISAIQLVLNHRWKSKVPFAPEEAAMAERCFASVPRQLVRELLDQGLWIHGKKGEVLVREGQPVTHLFYLGEGEARIASGGREVARSGAGHFFGEITVLTGAPAIASVTLEGPAHFWCIATDALRGFLAANPELKPVLEVAFAGDLRDKLRHANERMIALEERAP